MIIEVLGNCCATCHGVYENVKRAASEIDPSIEVIQDGNVMKVLQYHVMQTPAVVIDGQVLSMGHHLSVAEAKALIEDYQNKL